MLALVQNQVMQMEPVVSLPAEFEVRVQNPDSRGRGRLYLYLDSRIVEIGRTFFTMKKEGEAKIDGLSGHFVMSKGATATFRCVFGGQHIDVDVKA